MKTLDINNLQNLKQDLLKYGLVKISSPKTLTLNEFENIANSLGKPLVTDKHVLNDARTVQELSNKGLFSNGEVNWHNDWSYGRGNYFGTILHNVKNAELSPTWFCDMSKAPKYLFDLYKDAVGHYSPPTHLHNQCFTEKQLRLLEKQKISRPFVIKHHITGENILYCSISTIQNNQLDLYPIVNWIEENAYKHEWEKNDILIWDNLKMIHKRVAFEGERLLWRTQFLI